ncbi:MAG: HK97 family phage prohead protease [Thermoanaerobaculia bacterium]
MATKRLAGGAVKQQGCEFEAVIATIGVVDSDGDVIEPGAFAGAGAVPVLWGHDSGVIPIGKVRIEERGDLVVAVGSLIDDEACSWLRHDLATPPAAQQWSWGFFPAKFSLGDLDGQQVRFLEEVDLIEVSGVVRGASVGTRTLSAKGGCSEGRRGVTDRDLAEMGWARYSVEPDLELTRLAREIAGDDVPRVFRARRAKAGVEKGMPLPRGIGWCLQNTPWLGVDVDLANTKQSQVFTLAHELMHATGERDESECNDFARRVTIAFGWPEHAQAFYDCFESGWTVA